MRALSFEPESSLKSQGPGFALGDGNEILHPQPQLNGEVWILFYNGSFMRGYGEISVNLAVTGGQFRGRGAMSLETDAINQEKSLSLGGSNEDLAKMIEVNAPKMIRNAWLTTHWNKDEEKFKIDFNILSLGN